MNLKPLLLLLTVLGFPAWSQEYARSTAEPDVLIPLAVGNVWEYRDARTGEKAQARVIKRAEAEGQVWYLYEEFGELYWLRNNGVEQIEAIGQYGNNRIDGALSPATIFRPPAAVAGAYTAPTGDVIEYAPCEDPLTVPAGRFPCYRYTMTLGDGGVSTNHFAVGVGVIRNEFRTSEGVSLFELVEYSVQ